MSPSPYLRFRLPVLLGMAPAAAAATLHTSVPATTPDATVVTVLSLAAAACLAVVAYLQLADSRRTQAALEASELRFRTTFESAPIGMALLDRDGRVVETNALLRQMLGYERHELHALTLRDFCLDDDGEAARDLELFRELVAGRRESYETEKRYRRRDGTEFCGRIMTSIVSTPDGPCALRMIQDVTAKLALESQLRQSQKMEAVGRLAGGIAHDFNNLLTVIAGYADELQAELGDGPLQHSARAIREAAQRAGILTGRLLTFSRKDDVTLRPLDLNAVVSSVNVLLRRVIGEDVLLRTHVASDLGAVRGDAMQMEQVLVNLAVNARDAMPAGGTITVETANVDLDDGYAARHVGVEPGRYVMLSVSDTGCGMDAATRARIFEPFFTTKEAGRGTGLGLSTVFGIVKQCGGNIWVYSEAGQGTTFKIYLPRIAQPADPVGPQAETPAVAGTETILLVEDEDGVRDLVADALQRMGYTVLAAANAADAMTVAEAHRGPIAAMVTDVIMPGLNGPELYERMAVTRPGMRVLFMSGYTDRAIPARLIERNDSFLGKPFTRAELSRKLRSVLDAPHEQDASCVVR